MSVSLKIVAEKCADCIYDPANKGTKVAQIEACTSDPEKPSGCALWPYRPLTGITKRRLKEERIAAMTPEELEKYQERQAAARERLVRVRAA